MEFEFDANQEYQLEAIAAITDLFAGRPRNTATLTIADICRGALAAVMVEGGLGDSSGLGWEMTTDWDIL